VFSVVVSRAAIYLQKIKIHVPYGDMFSSFEYAKSSNPHEHNTEAGAYSETTTRPFWCFIADIKTCTQ
jgi:hypothetical protein